MTTPPTNRPTPPASEQDVAAPSDGELLIRFLDSRDEAALAKLVRRHGPMVWGVCFRMLRSHHDAEDAFQATFLVLIQKGASLPDKETLGAWLYGVAQCTAVRMRAIAIKRGMREKQVVVMPEPETAEQYVWNDLQPILDEELSRLPAKYRSLIVLCDLEGVTRKQVAEQLGIPEGTAATRLAAARNKLAKRLTRRGVVVSGVLLGSLLAQQSASASVPATAVSSTVHAAVLLAKGYTSAVAISGTVASLISGVKKAMFIAKLKVVVTAVMVVGLVCGVTGLGFLGGQTAVAEPAPAKEAKQLSDGANEPIRFAQLGQKRSQLIARFGEPKSVQKFVGGVESLEFHNAPHRMLIEIDPKTHQVVQIFYRKKTPFSALQIMELLRRNAEGQLWIPNEDGGFTRSDGGNARGKAGNDGVKFDDEYQFVVLSGTALMNKSPDASAKLKKELEDALSELEGF